MKKIILFFFLSLLSFCGYSQVGLPKEGFETGWTLAPTGASGTGWFTMQNDVSTAITWIQGPANSPVQHPPYEGERAAFLQRQNVIDGTPWPEDYLVTPEFEVPENPEIHFYSRLTFPEDQGSIYKIFIINLTATPDADINSPATYTEIQSWTELEINPSQMEYYLKQVTIPADYIGARVRIAFMMTGDDMDRWLIDNVEVVKKCERPTTLEATNLKMHSVDLTWENPSGAEKWDIEIISELANPTGVPTYTYTGSMPFHVDGLNENTCYKFYVRALCQDGGKSEWVGATYFCTERLGDSCNDPIPVATLPFTDTDDTTNFADNYGGVAGANCNTFEWEESLDGNDAVYKYTATFTGKINIDLSDVGPNAGVFIYGSCDDIGTACLGGGTGGDAGNDIAIDGFDVTNGEDYYIVISSSYMPTTPYTLIIQAASCDEPVGLPVTGIGMNSAELSWTNPTGATSWKLMVHPRGTGVPQGEGETITDNTNYLWEGLTISTAYEYWVRADCNNGTYSAWAGPYYFNTMACDPVDQCLFTFNMWGKSGNWDGHTMDVKQNGITIATLTGPTGFNQNTQVQVPICDGTSVELFWNSGDSWSAENVGVAIENSFQQEIFRKEPGLGTPNTSLYQLNVDCENPSCVKPRLNVSGITQTSANLSWDGPDTFQWEYVLQSPGEGIPASGTNTTGHQYNPDELYENTAYEFYVRANCGGGEFSEWAGPLAFKTLCSPFTAPFTEGFNSDSTTEDCWITKDVSGPAKWNLNYSNEPFEGDEVAVLDTEFMGGNVDWLISPAITMGANQRLRFHHKVSGFFGSNARFKVMLSTTGTDPEDFTVTVKPSANNNNFDYQENEIYLDDVPAGTVHFAWIFEGGSGSLFIDNIIIDPIPACPDPKNLTVLGVTKDSAELSWEPGFVETSWEVVVQAPGTGVPTGTGDAAIIPHPVGDLLPNTSYEYYVRATCGADGNSGWVGPFEFRTDCVTFDVPFHETFNSDSESVYCWNILDVNGSYDKWITNSTENTYEGDQSARYGAEFSQFNNDYLISPGINLTGNERLTYQYRVYSQMYPVTMRVLLSTTGTNPEDFTEVLVPVVNYDNVDYIKKVVDLSAYTGTVYIAWHAPPSNNPDGMYLYVDDVRVEAVAGCIDPYDLVVDNITPTSAKLSWTPGDVETEWEIVVQRVNEDAPTAGDITTSENPYTIGGLDSGTAYHFYIRSVCGDEKSVWNGPLLFITAITNDECADAIPLTVNEGIDCSITRSGTFKGATQSSQTGVCDGLDPVSDVWFKFVATAEKHNLTILNEVGWDVRMAIFEGDDCDNSDPFACLSYGRSITADNFVVGETYMVRMYATQATESTTFDLCVRTPLPPIKVDTTTYTAAELVNDVLVNSDCAQISNITYSTGTSFTGENGETSSNGLGYFEKNGSQFPIEKGIILSTGAVMTAPGPDGPIIEGDDFWLGDADLDAIVLEETGLPMNSKNATKLEFDFVPLIDKMSFDFLFASNEYGDYQCNFSDTFAFLLTDSDGNTTNIALVPGTDTPISVVTIRDDQYNPPFSENCPSVNPEYFAEFTRPILNFPVRAINFEGYTKTMTARATVVPNTMYHIKMVIADRNDSRFNSAVFLSGGSFNIGNAELGADLTVADGTALCVNEKHTIESGLSTEVFAFKWYRNDTLIEGQNEATLEVSQPGTYTMEVQVLGSDCSSSDSVIIEYYPDVAAITGNPEDLSICSDTGFETFDLAQNTTVILEGLTPTDYTVTYHSSSEDAQSGEGDLALNYENTVSPLQTIYARIVDNTTTCYAVKPFTINANAIPEFVLPANFSVCEGTSGVIEVTAINFEDADVTFAWTLNGEALPFTTSSISVTESGTYEVTITNKDCTAKGLVTVTILPTPVVTVPEDVTTCVSYKLPALTAGKYYTGPDATGTQLAVGTELKTTQTVYVYVESDTTPKCSAQVSFDVTIIPTAIITTVQGCEGYEYTLEVLFDGDEIYSPDNTTIEWTDSKGAVIGNEAKLVVSEIGIYTVTVTPTGGIECPVSEDVIVDSTACDIPRGISPNNDGKNDEFDLSTLKVKHLTIFNRYGKEVYKKDNYKKEFFGQGTHGDDLPTGTYFYMIEREGGESITGWLYINRQD